MSETTQTHDLNETDDRIAYTKSGRREPYRPSRRRLLESLTVGGSVLLAGCGQVNAPDSNGTETGTSATTGQVEDQTFRAPIRANVPNKTSFFFGGMLMHGSGPIQRQAYGPVVKEPASWPLRRFLRESGVWVSGGLAPTPQTQIQYNWIEEPIKITPTEVTLRIRDDAKWSDGHPVTGKDLAYIPLRRSLEGWASVPQYAPDAEQKPERVEFAFDDFHVRDKSVTYESSDGYFADFWDVSFAFWFGWLTFPTFEPTHLEPFDSYTDDIIDMACRAQAGEIQPWYVKGRNRDKGVQSLVLEHLTDPEWVRKFTKPNNVLSTGPWDLVEMAGTEFRFAPNSHHRHVDGLNFDSFVFEVTESTDRIRAALKADELDYGAPGITPKSVVDSFPDSIKEVRLPAAGDALQVNFDHPGFRQREVRMAVLYALDRTAIANNIHRSLATPVQTPGATRDNEFVNQDWIDENLTTYPHDRERAAGLMRDTGYTRDGEQWIGPEGTPFTLTLMTPSSPPKWEPTVASQLTEFGIDTTVQTLDPSVFLDRRDKGGFAIWSAQTSGFIDLWYGGVTKDDAFMIHPDEQYKTGEFTDGGIPQPRSKERWSTFTLEAPPVGEPDGPLREYPTGIWALSNWTNPSQEEYVRRIKKSMWLVNWFLPTIRLTRRQKHLFVDAGNWDWPTESATWQSFLNGNVQPTEQVLRHWGLRANTDSTK